MQTHPSPAPPRIIVQAPGFSRAYDLSDVSEEVAVYDEVVAEGSGEGEGTCAENDDGASD